MPIEISDLHLLSEGKPPEAEELLKKMTIGRELWLDYIRTRYLENYIAKGGSKVKVLIGRKGSGKTHLLKALLADAKEVGYRTVFLSALHCRLSNLPNLYQEIARHIIGEGLIRGLCQQIAKQIDETTEYEGFGIFSPFIYNQFTTPTLAEREIQVHITKFFRDVDLDGCFKAFGYEVAKARMISQSPENIAIACDWLKGLPAEDPTVKRQRRNLCLFGKLNKTNARDWLNSLVLLCKLAGFKGLVIGIDDLDAITERVNGRFLYTRNQVLDTCELVRQLIDDTEILRGCFFVLSGMRNIIEDRDRSFRSYDALWARIQIGLADYEQFNPFADLVDVDKHLASKDDFLLRIFEHIQRLLVNQMYNLNSPAQYRDRASELQRMVIDAVCSRGGRQ